LLEPRSYKNLFLPRDIMASWARTLSLLSRRRTYRKWDEGDLYRWFFNDVLAVNPAVRFWMGLVYKSNINGLARLYYPHSRFIRSLKFDELDEAGKPYIFFNAFNFDKKNVDLFANNPPACPRKRDHKPASPASLCACSALPYVEPTVEVDGHVYCEGALVDTVNFKSLLTDHKDLNEIWINRIVDAHQLRKPENLHDALANLCQLFGATVGEDDVKLFKLHVRENNRLPPDEAKKRNVPQWRVTIIEIHVDDHIDFQWSHKNLDDGRRNGARAAGNAYKLYKAYKDKPPPDGHVLMIPDDLTDQEILDAGVKENEFPLKRKREREARRTSP
jgi:predicted acylesterase/phospholipase RssA